MKNTKGKKKNSLGQEDETQKQRKIAVDNITRIKKSIEEKTISFDSMQLQCRLDILNQYIDNAMILQDDIDAIHYNPDQRAELEDLCVSTKAQLLSLINTDRRSSVHNTSTFFPNKTSHLPKMKLPKFSGKYADFKNFIGLFESLVDSDQSLSDIQKFSHLISCLTDEALGTVKAYQVTEENYSKALASLKSVYDNKCLIFFNTISKLFEIPKNAKPSAAGIRNIVDTFSAIYESLLSVGDDKNISNALLIHLAMSKVDPTTKSKWEEQLDYNNLPLWQDCKDMLNKRFQHLSVEESSTSQQNDAQQKNKSTNKSSGAKKSKQSSLSVAKSESKDNENKCFHCQSNDHFIYSCPTFKNILVADRIKSVKDNNLCLNCLRKGHSASNCKSSKCRVCQDAHNTLLHRYTENATSLPVVVGSNSTQQPTNTQSIHHALIPEKRVILATAIVQIRNAAGEFILARALLDSGSQVNCMTEELANSLALKKRSNAVPIVGIGNSNQKIRHAVATTLKSRFNDFKFESEYLVMRSISTYHPDCVLPVNQWDIPKNIELADPLFFKPQRVDILIGAETFFDLLCVGQIKTEPHLPTIQKTVLGWIISGKYQVSSQNSQKSCFLLNSIDNSFDLHQFVKRCWEFEELPSQSNTSKLTSEQLECEQKFIQSVKRLPSGRLQVSLPFKAPTSVLGASFDTAKRRFLSLERKLGKNPDMRELYMDFMSEYVRLGHMSPTSNSIPTGPHYFIPHQCVLRPSSLTTKLRVVFDASSKTTSQISLNDILMVGATIQPELYATILRFRLHKFAITADITKMYRQIEVDEADRDFQLILWRKNPSDPIQTFRLNTVTYGTSPAPFLAIRCLKYLSDMYSESHPIGSRTIANNFYVDDLLAGAEHFQDLEIIRSEVTEILASAGFQLAKWYSNHPSYEENRTERPLKVNDTEYTKALGITWSPRDDNFKFHFENDFDHMNATKRNILSISSRLFDPLGLLSPVVIRSKMLLQELWLNDLSWDESIPQRLNTCWQNFKADLALLSSISIPRFVEIYARGEIEIHGFADASIRAYGCCLYVRSKMNNVLQSHLLTAKSRVAPLKTRSLPRLELSAAHLLAKLWSTVQPLLNFKPQRVVFWSDSEITLHWLKSHPSTLNTFVANRVSETQELSKNVKWFHVPSKFNPADLVSRGCRATELKDSIWFEGPKFLCQDPSLWPKNKKFELTEEQLILEKRKTQVTLVATEVKKELLYELVDNTSSYPKLLRIVAYILRVRKLKKRKIDYTKPPSAKELRLAFLKIVQLLQSRAFNTEIQNLTNSRDLAPVYQKLNPFIHNFKDDQFNFLLIRVGGRLLNAPIPYDARFPLLLPQCQFVETYLRYLHMKNCHAGAKVLIGLLRQEIWLLNAREQCTKIVRRCVHCFKYKPVLMNQLMGNLPTERVTSNRPFLISGVDFCGPVNVTLKIRGKPPAKVYIAVFVCFASKAIHLETVTDLSSNCFILCLKRFIGRRGLPQKIVCDNATNFIGAQRKLEGLKAAFISQKDHLESFAAEEGLEFAFIPPRAPHFGGLWEAGVKSAKTLLVKAIGKMLPTTEELQTILIEIEAILNSRPLTPLTNDPNDGEALTPAHLLHGEMLRSLPPESVPNVDEAKMRLLKRWQQLSAVKTAFWKAWSRDYLLTLQQRNKWHQDQPNLDVGKIVMIHEDNCRPQQWLTGRVVNVSKGSDNKVRVADVQTKAGVYRRPITKLAILPTD